MHVHVLAALAVTRTRIRHRLSSGGPRDRGDVPGWVLVTVMTAGLVAGLWAVAGDTLNDLFRDSISGVAP